MKTYLRHVAVALCLFSPLGGVQAQSWPARPITIVVPFPPAGTPAAAVDGINAAMNKALQSEAIRNRLMSDGSMPGGGSPQEFQHFIEQEIKTWGEVARQAGVTLD